MNRPLSYHRLPLSSSMVALVLFVLMMVVWIQGGYNATGTHLIFLSTSYITWGLLLPLVQGIVISFNLTFRGFLNLLTNALLLILIHFILSNILYYIIQYFFVEVYTAPSMTLLQNILGASLLARSVDFVLFFGLLSWIQRSKELNEKALKLMTAEANLDKLKLKSLQSQLNPHFLFNTLHTVSALIGHNDDKARQITIQISRLLRKVLEANEIDRHTLDKELEFIDDYLAIEKERFRDRLYIDIDIDEEALEIIIPTFMLQPLIENAFKHGIGQVEGKTILTLSIKKNEESKVLQITVINDVPKNNSKQIIASTGIGLSNLKNRLETFYQGKSLFSTQKTSKNTFEAHLTLPLSL
jgi:two-component system LytT family sensor kinase